MAFISMNASTLRATGFRPASGLLCALLLLASASTLAQDEIEDLLALEEAPFGVVFELVYDQEDALEILVPRVHDYIERLRQKFPATEFAVVSHGREEFALQSAYREDFPELHAQIQSLVADQVPVHVCETHAGWYGVTAEDFPEYVDVAPTGPGQIALYRELGYHLVVVY